jgi:hypothetical protein
MVRIYMTLFMDDPLPDPMPPEGSSWMFEESRICALALAHPEWNCIAKIKYLFIYLIIQNE